MNPRSRNSLRLVLWLATTSALAAACGNPAGGGTGDATPDGSADGENDATLADSDSGDIIPLDDIPGPDASDGVDETASDLGVDLSGGDGSGQDADVSPDLPDANCATFGCECDGDDACESGVCIQRPGLPGLCSVVCEETCPAPGFVCRLLTNSGGDVVQLCVPDESRTCEPCESAADCLTLSSVCTELIEGARCLPGCVPGGLCPSGSICTAVGTAFACVPEFGTCEDCLDADGDGFGLGPECAGPDCDDDVSAVFPGAVELCDNLDNNCDGDVDENFDLADDPANCGVCDLSCAADDAMTYCEGGVCVIDACTPGHVDCDGLAETGCEEFPSADSCFQCSGATTLPGQACGTCGSGSFVCNDRTLTCGGDLGDGAFNACGGCAGLSQPPGAPCGTCGSGVVVCDGNEAVVCAFDQGADAQNVCGGCDILVGEPGDVCGECAAGQLVCITPNLLACVGAGATERNGCGGCAPIEEPGSTCGTCDSGLLVCDGLEALRCEGDRGAAARNDCGGCGALALAPGEPCGACNSGVGVCVTTESSACSGDLGGEALNACGGCTPLLENVGDACATCEGIWACDGTDRLVCDGAREPSPAYPDGDRDGFGAGSITISVCDIPDGFSLLAGDCDNNDSDIFPGSGAYCSGSDVLSCTSDGATLVQACGSAGCDAGACINTCEGRDDGAYGEVCSRGSDCCNGLCFGNAVTGEAMCTEACDSFADCNSSGATYRCYDVTGGGFCTTNDFGLSCGAPEDCLGEACLGTLRTTACTWQCQESADCPSNAMCGLVPFDGFNLWVCTTIGQACTSYLNCLSGSCLTDDFGNNGYCTAPCDAGDPSACPSGYFCGAIAGEPYRYCQRGG